MNPSMKRRVLIIGAAGHLGNALTRALLDRGCEVIAVGRRPEPPRNLAGLNLVYKAGDADAPDQLERWIDGCDLVVDAAAPYPLQAFSLLKPALTPLASAEKRTARLIKAVLGAQAELLHIGSFVTCLRPRSATEWLQNSLARFSHPYFEIKSLIETRLLDSARHGLRVVIVNPTYCMGPWDLHDRQLCVIPLLLSGEMRVTTRQRLNVIDTRDVALATINALERRRYAEPTVLAGHDIRIDELHSLISRTSGASLPSVTIPSLLAAAAAYWLDTAQLMSTVMMADMFTYLPDEGDHLRALGVEARPLADTIRDATAWYRQIGYC
jgi:dihydroflavonol-4-reductase